MVDAFAAGGTQIYVSALHDYDAAQLRLLERTVLLPDERARARVILRAENRRAHIVAHALKRQALRALLGHTPRLVRSASGKPGVQGQALQFSLSHCDSHVALAVSRREPVGVDIESLAMRVSLANVMQAALTGDEQVRVSAEPDSSRSFLIHWTAKEAYVKATGEGLNKPFGELSLDAGHGALQLVGPGVAPHGLRCWSTRDYVLSACALGRANGPFCVAHALCTAAGLQAERVVGES